MTTKQQLTALKEVLGKKYTDTICKMRVYAAAHSLDYELVVDKYYSVFLKGDKSA